MNNVKNEGEKEPVEHFKVSMAWWGLAGLIVFYVGVDFTAHYCNGKSETLLFLSNEFCIALGQILLDLIAVLIAFLFVYYVFVKHGFTFEKKLNEHVDNTLKQFDVVCQELKVLSSDVDYLKNHTNGALKIYDIVREQNEKIRNLMIKSARSHPFVSSYYKHVMIKYHEDFSILRNGFHINDEYLSLMAYQRFWDYLVSEQRKINLKQVERKPIIARVVHANSIDIWTNERDKYKAMTNSLLDLQRKFVNLGGTIVRVFIGNGPNANKDYEKAMRQMEAIKIEVKYLQKNTFYKIKYDFVLLYDEKMVVKWFSDNVNEISGSLIHDSIEREVMEVWGYIFDELERLKKPITSIPSDRQFRMEF